MSDEQHASEPKKAKQNTSPKFASGGGFQFENEAVAYVLAHLLARSTPFDPPGGMVERVDTQRPATQWHLDDLLVTARAHSRRHRLAFSIKSDRQITRNGFPDDFVHDAWKQLLHDSSDVFDENRDYLGLLTAPLGADLRTAVYELFRLARDQAPDDLAVQVNLSHRANATVRKLHESARCPDDLAAKYKVDVATSAGRLLRRLLWIPLDFEDDGSVRRIEALSLCQSLLRSGLADEARTIWGRLKEVADRLRRGGGGIDLPRLVDELRVQFELRDFPDHVADWDRIADDTRSAAARVRSTIGGTVMLPRTVVHQAVSDVFADQRTAVLLGASGTGKSAIAKDQAQRSMKEGKAFWLDAERLGARTLAEWRNHLGLAHPLGDIVRAAPTTDALLVLDGLDRLYNEVGFAVAAEFVKNARIGDPDSPWRLLITCTPEEWGRVRDSLASHGVILPHGSAVSVDLPDPAELEAVWAAFPRLAALRYRRHLAPILFRPKVLDLLATHSRAEDDLTLIGESDLARLFWDREVARGPHALARAEAAGRVAVSFADQLRPDVSVSGLTTAVGPIDLAAVDELVQDRILVRVDGRMSFDHDLYADWIRVRQLRDTDEDGQLSAFLTSRLGSPVWHRALRLYGIDLLEQADDITPWTRAFEAVGTIPDPAGALAQDILLEATAFASVRGVGLLRADLWPILSENDGRLLVRLLNRLFHTATVANTTIVDAVSQEAPDLAIHIAAGARLPYWPYWYGILAFLHTHCNEIPLRARGLAARSAGLWLRSTLPSWPLREEAAEIAVTLGDVLLKDKEEHDAFHLDGESDQQVYRAVLAAGHEEPERVTQIVLEAAGRRDRRFAPPPLTEDELNELRKRLPTGIPPSLSGSRGPLPDPWPHGPVFRVDGALQKVVFETDGLVLLAEALPDVARETLLALLISEPKPRRSFYDDSIHERFGLEWPMWHPQFYTRGPFRSFLAKAEDEAVMAILQIVEHATDRWVEARARGIARTRGCSPDEITTPTLSIEVEGEMRQYVGNSRVYTWSLYGPDQGQIVGSALAALEKHLYDRADAGDDLTPLIQRLLTKSRSLAIFGLLGVFGRRHPMYLRGPLRGLLGSPYVLSWTLTGSVSVGWESSLAPGFTLVPVPLHEEYRAWHEMPHRKTCIRDLALWFFVNDPGLRSYFQDVRDRFLQGLQPGEPYEGWDLVENLVAQFNPDNYAEFEGDDGKNYIQYTPPEELQRKHAEMEEAMAPDILLMTLPLQCRQFLNGEEPIDSEVLNQFWEHAQQIGDLNSEAGDDLTPPAQSLAGVAAVITLRGGGWREVHPDRDDWARKVILDAAREDRSGELYGGMVNWDRLMFAAETIPSIWSERPNDPEVREAVASLTLHGPPDTVGILAAGVARIRVHLPDDHKRLLRAILLRAGLMRRLRDAESRTRWKKYPRNPDAGVEADGEQEAVSLREELASVEQALVEGTLDATIPGLDEVAPLHLLDRHGSSGRAHRRRMPYRPINEALVIAAYRGVPNPSASEEDPWLDVWERAVHETTSPLTQPDTEPSTEPDKSPGAWDLYLMERIADVVANTQDLDDAKRLWQPIIGLGASATRWVSWFARYWTPYALYPAAADHVVASWTAMIDTALVSPRWSGGAWATFLDHQTGVLWRSLLGFVHSYADVWTEELRSRVLDLQPQLTAWAGTHLTNPDNVRIFAHILTLPAAVDLVLSGLVWLHDAAMSGGSRFWGWPGQVDIADGFVFTLLVHVWNNAHDELRHDAAAFAAFQGLLERLVSRQYAPAFELAERVGAIPRP